MLKLTALLQKHFVCNFERNFTECFSPSSEKFHWEVVTVMINGSKRLSTIDLSLCPLKTYITESNTMTAGMLLLWLFWGFKI